MNSTDKEITEYKTLCAVLEALEEKYLKRKEELCRLLEETLVLKKNAFLFLAEANRLTRHLTGRQRQTAGLSYHLGEIKARIRQVNQINPVLFQDSNSVEEDKTLSEIREFSAESGRLRTARSPADHLSLGKLRQKGLAVLKMIDRVRKNLLQLDLLEMRCRELLLSINKALEAFRHEFAVIRRKIYPFGIFSVVYRFLRSLRGGSYFSPRDMEDVSVLGNLTGHVLKIADSPII